MVFARPVCTEYMATLQRERCDIQYVVIRLVANGWN